MSPTNNDDEKPAAVKVNQERKFGNEKKNLNEFIKDKLDNMKQENKDKQEPSARNLPVYETESESEESKEEANKLEKFLVKWKPISQEETVHEETEAEEKEETDNSNAQQARDCVAKGPGVACKQCLKGEPCVWIEVQEHLTEIATNLTNTYPFIDNFKVRQRLYQGYTHRVYGNLGKDKRIPMPTCVELMIKLTWPNDYHESYEGFKSQADIDEEEEE
jgi:hypothetical protein